MAHGSTNHTMEANWKHWSRRVALCLFAALLVFAACDSDDPIAPETPEPAENVGPTAAIQFPPATTDPTPLEPLATFGVTIADPDDGPADLSFRYVFVAIGDYGNDWTATEDTIASSPDSLAWSSWTAYVPDGTAMSVTTPAAIPLGFHVLAVQGKDSDNVASPIGSAGMRRVLIRDGDNDPPIVTIQSPARDVNPLAIGANPTFTFLVTDVDDLTENLSFRWAFVRTSNYAGDWHATEAALISDPGSFAWSDWAAYTPGPGDTVDVTVPTPLDSAPYVLAVQARDAAQQTSLLSDRNLRRLVHCNVANELPTVSISIPPSTGSTPALVPPIFTFHFTATDADNDTADLSARWALVDVSQFNDSYDDAIMYLRKDPAILAQYGRTEQDVDDEWTVWVTQAEADTLGPLDFGPYVLAVMAQDPCGGQTPVLDESSNVRRIRVGFSSTGPALQARNDLIGSITTSSCSTPPVIADMFAGLPIIFEFSADASAYGGIAVGYRYGWDIVDLEDDTQWEIDFTPFVSVTARTPVQRFFFGTHTMHIQVIDNCGLCSMVEFKINLIQYAPTRDLLLIDDYYEDPAFAGWDNTGRGVLPSDDEHDAFWIDMLSNAPGFGPAADVVEVSGSSTLPITMVANYRNIIWSVLSNRDQSSQLPLLYEYIQYRQKYPPPSGSFSGKVEPNILAMFMAVGGHVMICGEHPVSNVRSRSFPLPYRYPLVLAYELEGDQSSPPNIDVPVGDESFGYRELCVDVLDYAVPTLPMIRTDDTVFLCSVEGIRVPDANSLRDDSMREAIPIDMSFPRLHMHDMAAGIGKFYELRGLDVEIFNPQYFEDLCILATPSLRSCFEPIYGLHCQDNTVVTYGQPIAFWTSAFADVVPEMPGGVAARSVVFGFSPVFFEPAEVRPAIEHILFDEWDLPRTP